MFEGRTGRRNRLDVKEITEKRTIRVRICNYTGVWRALSSCRKTEGVSKNKLVAYAYRFLHYERIYFRRNRILGPI